jgi:hypothetical protein
MFLKIFVLGDGEGEGVGDGVGDAVGAEVWAAMCSADERTIIKERIPKRHFDLLLPSI